MRDPGRLGRRPAEVTGTFTAGRQLNAWSVGQRERRGGGEIRAMNGPNFVRYIGPVLGALKQLGGSGRPAEVREIVAQILALPDPVLDEQSAGGNNRYDNQVAWARFYLAKAGYIDASKRGVWSLTEKGLVAPDMSHAHALQLFKEVHAEFGGTRDDADEQPSTETIESGEISPEQTEEGAASHWRQQLLSLIRSLPPAGFERLCQRLLRESGFEHVSITGRAGDGGIDGIGVLQVNPLVSFKVLFQCKKYSGSVSPSQVRDFRGAMQGRADKGIMLTTGAFTADAKKEALRDGVPPIELVDGEKLIEMFESLELGLKQKVTFELDPPFFEQFKA
jgi:restriction system protein